jgi:histidinol phosphatase-like enzyme (inositol monophosphatase family)
MSENQYIQKDIMEFCNRVLDSSGEVAMKYFRQIRSLSLKGDTSPVTQADHDIESLIREEINIAYPGHNIIGEEFSDEVKKSDFTWYIDPIDGTRSFISGKRDFGTLLSLSFKNEIVAGVIDCPALQERWGSYTVGKTYLNGKETVCRAVKDLEDSVMATTSSHEFGLDKWRAYQSLEQSVNVTTTGSDCYNYGLLVSGYIDLVAEKLTAPYDYLPLVKIVEGAGGVITDWGGNKLPLNGENIYVLAAASPELHKQALGKSEH